MDIWHCEQLQKVQHNLHDCHYLKSIKICQQLDRVVEHTACKFMPEATDHWQVMQASNSTTLSTLWHRGLLSQTWYFCV